MGDSQNIQIHAFQKVRESLAPRSTLRYEISLLNNTINVNSWAFG